MSLKELNGAELNWWTNASKYLKVFTSLCVEIWLLLISLHFLGLLLAVKFVWFSHFNSNGFCFVLSIAKHIYNIICWKPSNAWEQRSIKNPFTAASCYCCCWCCRHHCRHHNARAAECVHICGCFDFVAHCQSTYANTYSHMHADMRWKRFAERKRETCDVFYKLWLCGIRTHMCMDLHHMWNSRSLTLSLSPSNLSLSPLFSIVIIIYLSVCFVSLWEHLSHLAMVEWRRPQLVKPKWEWNNNNNKCQKLRANTIREKCRE